VANLSPDQLRRLARLGAVARLEQLRAEEAAIRGEFPELFGRGRRGAEMDGTRPGTGSAERAQKTEAGGSGRRRRMSAAARRAVSQRMRKYWAERRKAKAGK
jgi:hypothetical protein